MKNKPTPIKPLPFLIIVVVILLFIFGGLAVSRLFNTPLAKPLSLRLDQATATSAPAALAEKAQPVELPTETATVTQAQAAADNTVTLPMVVEQQQAGPSAGTCGMDGTLTLLFTGADFNGGVPPLGADAVRVIQYDFDAQTINIVAFPRDLWVKVGDLDDPARKEERLGPAFYTKKLAATGSDRQKIEAATTLVAQVLYDNFAVLPDHYLTLQLDSVASIVDTIGGVEITLPEAITTDRGVTFPAGPQTLDGRLSSEYLRAYLPGGDSARLLRQNRYIEALRARAISTGVITKVPQLIEQFGQSIVTDLTPTQLAGLACAMEKIPPASTHFYQIGGDLVVSQSDGALRPVSDKIDLLLQTAFGNEP